jgi:2-isopropylmalate synthase
VSFAVTHGLTVMYVTEDTVRAHPDTLRRLFLAAIRAGARRLCLCDTVGHATPTGAANLVRFALDVVRESGSEVGLDWHGHSDRGLGVINTLAAIRAGVTRVHGCAIGLGERVGNTAMDQLLVNLRLLGWIDNDLTALPEYCELASRSTGVPIPPNYPVVGRDAFRTGTGVHAAAIIKAERKGDAWLADRIYSGVPAAMFGKEQEIEIGHYSGESNVIYWLKKRGYEPTKPLVAAGMLSASVPESVAPPVVRRPLIRMSGEELPRPRRLMLADGFTFAMVVSRRTSATLVAPVRAISSRVRTFTGDTPSASVRVPDGSMKRSGLFAA